MTRYYIDFRCASCHTLYQAEVEWRGVFNIVPGPNYDLIMDMAKEPIEETLRRNEGLLHYLECNELTIPTCGLCRPPSED